ncbi:hypothetical protein KFE25_001412 [Diacronema lutheri]|uniref:Uncharacterized protein n=1 Tax=Diacronema lutheri TaxID=2081491 RepID=A0A8J5XJV6_DIALT|nr:hypothetical protein KFE25_001412 [Diacronema lutheri]
MLAVALSAAARAPARSALLANRYALSPLVVQERAHVLGDALALCSDEGKSPLVVPPTTAEGISSEDAPASRRPDDFLSSTPGPHVVPPIPPDEVPPISPDEVPPIPPYEVPSPLPPDELPPAPPNEVPSPVPPDVVPPAPRPEEAPPSATLGSPTPPTERGYVPIATMCQ